MYLISSPYLVGGKVRPPDQPHIDSEKVIRNNEALDNVFISTCQDYKKSIRFRQTFQAELMEL